MKKPILIWEPSAFKHGYTEEDIVWVITHAFKVAQIEDRLFPGQTVTLFLGMLPPPCTQRIEVMAKIEQSKGLMIIYHALRMRDKWLYLFNEA